MPSVHRQTFVDLVKQHGWTRGAELGVDRGILTGMLLRACPNLSLIGVDTFPDRERSSQALNYQESYPLLWLIKSRTNDAAARIPDQTLDFVFIDADHTHQSVREDIAHWAPKVRPGGWIGGHDYHPRKWPGVVKAVNEAFGKKVQHWPGTIWGVWR